MKRFLVLFLFCSSLYGKAAAQIQLTYGNVRGLQIQVLDSAKKAALVQAQITIVSGKQQITRATDERGYLFYREPLDDSVKLTINYMGYEPLQTVVRTPAALTVYLAEKKYELSEIIVTGDVVAVVTKGDTVRFNAEAFKTMEGDAMSRLFKKLPGMQLEDGRLHYQGEEIRRITIDGNRLFDGNVMLALENIRADDVVDVSVYKEVDDWEKLNKIANAKPVTVANVTTKSKPSMIRNITLSGGIGAETAPEERKMLYDASGKLVYSRVGETVTADAGLRNIPSDIIRIMTPNTSTTIPSPNFKQWSGGFSYGYNNASKYIFNTNNQVSSKRDVKEGWTRREYFPTDDYLSRSDHNRKISDAKMSTVYSSNQGRYTFRDKSAIDGFGVFTYTGDIGRSANTVLMMQDSLPLQNRHILEQDKMRAFSFNERLSYRKALSPKIRLSVEAAIDISENDGEGWRVDTLPSSSSQIYLENNSGGYRRKYSGKAGFSFPLASNFSLEVSDELAYIDSKSLRTSLDRLTGITDVTNTWDYRIHELNNTVGTSIAYRDYQKQQGWSVVTADIQWKSNNMQRNEQFPEQYDFPRTFQRIQIRSDIEYKFSAYNTLKGYYTLMDHPIPIPIADLREFIDDSNPAMIRAGNPHLKIPVWQGLSIKGDFIKGAAAYGFEANYTQTINAIVDKQRYFTEETYLPEYDYTASAGSSLITKENRNGTKWFRVSANYSARSKKWKSNITARILYEHNRRPEFVNEEAAMRIGNRYFVSLGITGNFSSAIEPFLSSTSDYNHSNGYLPSKWFSQTLDFGMRSLIAGVIECNSSNSLYWNVRWPDAADLERFGLVSNISLGYKCGKKKNFILRLEGNDLFNKKQFINIDTQADYIATSYAPYQLRRHVLLRAEWKF